MITTEKLSEYITAIDNLPENFISFKMRTIGTYIDLYDPVLLVTWLRTTYPRRDYIWTWHEFLKQVDTELRRRGLDAGTILRGLEETHFDKKTEHTRRAQGKSRRHGARRHQLLQG